MKCQQNFALPVVEYLGLDTSRGSIDGQASAIQGRASGSIRQVVRPNHALDTQDVIVASVQFVQRDEAPGAQLSLLASSALEARLVAHLATDDDGRTT